MPYVPENGDIQRWLSAAHRRTVGSGSETHARTTIQESLSLSKDNALIWLENWRWPNGRVCPMCACVEAWVGRRGIWLCKRCRHQYTWSSGTVLANPKRGPEVYVAALRVAPERVCSANFFANEVGMQSSAAVRLFQKIGCLDVGCSLA